MRRSGHDPLRHLSYALQAGVPPQDARLLCVGEIFDLHLWQLETDTRNQQAMLEVMAACLRAR
jgi:hypothetical protein